jgi:hypothetical protein
MKTKIENSDLGVKSMKLLSYISLNCKVPLQYSPIKLDSYTTKEIFLAIVGELLITILFAGLFSISFTSIIYLILLLK